MANYKCKKSLRRPDSTPVSAEFSIGAYHRLFEIEKSFRMSKRNLQARPIHRHLRDKAHLTIVFATLAVSRWIEDRTGLSIRPPMLWLSLPTRISPDSSLVIQSSLLGRRGAGTGRHLMSVACLLATREPSAS